MNRTGTLALALVLLSGCSSKKPEIPAGAYRNDEYRFAVLPPPGWTQVTPATAADFHRSYYRRLLEPTQEIFLHPVQGKTFFVVAWVKTDATEPLLPVIAVTYNTVGLLSVGRHELDTSTNVVKKKLANSGWTGVEMEESALVKLDGFEGIRLQYQATAGEFKFRTLEVMATSQSCTHFVSLNADQQNWETNKKTYEATLETFRRLVGG